MTRSRDTLSLEILDLMDNYQQLQSALTASFKKGFIEMSHARKSMGNTRVGRLQYDKRMQTNYNV